MDIFPVEIHNLILIHRAQQKLREICAARSINYQRLCKFIEDYNGAIFGSATLACFTQTNTYNDIDIMVQTTDDMATVYKEFLNVFDLDQSMIGIEKSPLCDPHNANQCLIYSLRYFYPLEMHEKPTDKTMSVDMSIIDFSVYQSLEAVFDQCTDVDCAKLYFDKHGWNIPFGNNIFQFLENRLCTLTDPFIRGGYFDKIYDPYNSCVSEEFNDENEYATSDNKLISTINKIYTIDTTHLPIEHQNVYHCVLPSNIKNMLLLAKKITDRSITDFNDLIPGLGGETTKQYSEIFALIIKKLNWNSDQAIIKCCQYLGQNPATLPTHIKCRILKEFCRITKYMSYGFQFTNLDQLTEFNIFPNTK